MNTKRIVKSLYTYLFNWNHILRFKSFGKGSFIGRRLTVNSPKGAIEVGDNVRLGEDSRLSCYKAEGHNAHILIKDNCYIGSHFSILTADEVIIEENVLMASFINILGENHGMNPECGRSYGGQPLETSPVRIGHHSWIGQNVTIVSGRKGVKLGSWCIIGAGSVVTKSVPDYCMAVGNPARVIKKYDFSEHKWIPIDSNG